MFNDISIIILTALGQEEDIIKGLETGADDYVTKPFSFPVLEARIKSVLRRRRNEDKENGIYNNDIQILNNHCLVQFSMYILEREKMQVTY